MGRKGQKLRKYSPEERRSALRRLEEVGLAAASRELDIPVGTLSCWSHLARKGELPGGPGEPSPGDPAPSKAADGSAAGSNGPASEAGAVEEASAGGEDVVVAAVKRTRNVARVYTPSEPARALELADEVGVTETSRRLGMSRFSIRERRRKARLHAAGKAKTSPVVDSNAPSTAYRLTPTLVRHLTNVHRQAGALGAMRLSYYGLKRLQAKADKERLAVLVDRVRHDVRDDEITHVLRGDLLPPNRQNQMHVIREAVILSSARPWVAPPTAGRT